MDIRSCVVNGWIQGVSLQKSCPNNISDCTSNLILTYGKIPQRATIVVIGGMVSKSYPNATNKLIAFEDKYINKSR